MTKLRTDYDRLFRSVSGLATVPAGKLPEEVGVDSRSAMEVPAPPHAWARWVGSRRGWVVTARAHARAEAEALNVRGRSLGRGGLLAMIEALEDRVRLLEQGS